MRGVGLEEADYQRVSLVCAPRGEGASGLASANQAWRRSKRLSRCNREEASKGTRHSFFPPKAVKKRMTGAALVVGIGHVTRDRDPTPWLGALGGLTELFFAVFAGF